MTLPAAPVDWSAIAGGVARALFGEPSSATARELRFGRRGSLSVRLDTGQWFDHENGTGGGVLDLVVRECGSRGAALDWLESAGFVAPRAGASGTPPPESARRADSPGSACPSRDGARGPTHAGPSPESAPGEPERDPRALAARRLWAATVSGDDTPGRAYLTVRNVWPPRGLGPDLPRSVRWLSREAAPAVDRAAKWYGLPTGAAGALVFAWRRDGDRPKAWPAALSLLAVTAAGERMRWFVRLGSRGAKTATLGSRAGALFEARAGGDAEPVHVAEGELDALALAIAPWAGPGRVVAAGGTAGMKALAARGTGPVALHGDGDRAGRGAGLKAATAIRDAGRECRIERYGPDEDPASTLAGDVGERAAIREYDGGLPRRAATRAAWRDVLGLPGADETEGR